MIAKASPYLIDLSVEHEYFGDGACDCLVFEPDAATARELGCRRIPVRFRANGFRIHATSDSILGQDLTCRFLACSTSPLFELFTECPALDDGTALHYADSRTKSDGTLLEPSIDTAPPSKPGRPTRISVDLTIPVVPGSGRAFKILLAARSSHWKYHLFGELARRKVEIVDLDATESGIRFVPSENINLPDAASWISQSPIPARRAPSQRIQLRDTETGRVLVKRLPNPDFRTFGREPLRTGGTALVVEAFIHP